MNTQLSLSYGKPTNEDWVNVSFFDNTEVNTLKIGQEKGESLTAIEYWLNLEDVYPTSGGLISHGKSVLQRAKAALGVSSKPTGTYEASVEFSDTTLAVNEKAVLERLILGQLDVLSNTLIGSPQIIGKLLTKGKIVFLPSFNHIGVDMDYLLKGEIDAVRSIAKQHSLETTLFRTDSDSVAIVSAPSTWKQGLFEAVTMEGISIWPILTTASQRNILRSENLFPDDKIVNWTD